MNFHDGYLELEWERAYTHDDLQVWSVPGQSLDHQNLGIYCRTGQW